MAQSIKIGKVASSVGLTPQAIRFYERLGLIEKTQRASFGYRVYSLKTFERVQFIKQAQTLGLSLQEIREVLRLKYSGQSPCNCVRGILKKRLAQLKEQMADMEKMRREIERCVSASVTLSRLPHEASSICPLIESKIRRRKRNFGKERR